MSEKRPLRLIQVGVGGFGRRWIEEALPANISDGTIELVAIADVNPDALVHARQVLGLPEERCFSSATAAFDAVGADFCLVVVPPESHEEVVNAAIERDLDVLCEKPIADTMAASIRIEDKVRRRGRKMAVTMTHRFDQFNTSFRHALADRSTGDLDYLVFRLTGQLRRFGAWSAFRHRMSDPMLIEGAVHHLDMISDFAGSKCRSVYAQTWNPRWGEFAGDSQVLALLTFENGVKASYEGTCTNAVGLNEYYKGYVRAECENATLILQHRRVERFNFEPEKNRAAKREGEGTEIPLLERPKWGNAWLIEQFADWLWGGAPAATNVHTNLQTQAIVFAAIESSRTGTAVDVQRFLESETQRVLGMKSARASA